MSKMSDFKQIRKWNICFEEVSFKCINIVLSSRGLTLYIFLWVNQTLGANFGVAKSGYRSQKQPLLSPVDFLRFLIPQLLVFFSSCK